MPKPPIFRLNPQDLSDFAWVEHASMWHYIEGYEEAAIVLLDAAVSADGVRASSGDRLVFPLSSCAARQSSCA
jgi:hypothetical protein